MTAVERHGAVTAGADNVRGTDGLGVPIFGSEITVHREVLRVDRLVAGYRDRREAVPIVGPADLTVRSGRFHAVLGPNGAGKTTLLRTLAGVMQPLEGEVIATTPDSSGPLRRLRRDALARHVAVVLTDHPDVGLLRARDVVAIGRYPHTGWSGRLGSADLAIIADSLAAVGATELADRELSRLSDGQRQRVWIARALAQEPEVLLLDEPTAFLDLPGRVETIGLLRELAASRGLAVVASIHDLDLALRVADVVWLLDGSGQVAVGAPEDLALAGDIDLAFGRADIRFDVTTASFSLPTDCCTEVNMVGADGGPPDPVLAMWTSRALTRGGAIVVERPAWLEVVVPRPSDTVDAGVGGAAGPWTIRRPDEEAGGVHVDDLAGVVRLIRRAALTGRLGE